jgi:uncharacterized protein (DUF924 family)
MDPRIEEIIAFWFGQTFEHWFEKDPVFDEQIRNRFGALQADAAGGSFEAWRKTPRGNLALLIVLDQFSRNLFRDDPRAFASDSRALSIARKIARAELTLIQQLVSLMPYQHSENLAIQDEGLAVYQALAAADPDNKMLATSLDFAKRHRDIIQRFGRFPHRNAILGRPSTPDELAFLQQPGSSF